MTTHSENLVSTPGPLSGVLGRRVAGSLESLRRWHASRRTVRLLDALSDRQLRDIGILCRADIRADIRDRARNGA